MDFRRILVVLFFSIGIGLVHATPNTGIALVHGTNDHRYDAYGRYWKVDFIQTMAHALPNPENIFVVHCDFSHYMWHENAGGCAAQQLLDFIAAKKLSSITVYTHSNGGNVMRWILSNPTFDPRYLHLKDKITQVIAIAPSSKGTPIADMVLSGNLLIENLSWFLGYHGDAIKQQRVGDMQIYNNELLFGTQNRPSLPVLFQAIIGTNVVSSPMLASSYCNGLVLNSALQFTKLYLDRCSDGFLNCDSQNAAGTIWFYDNEKLTAHLTLSHNQSRHSCFGLAKLLVSALTAKEL